MRTNAKFVAALLCIACASVALAVSPQTGNETGEEIKGNKSPEVFSTNSTIDDYLIYAFENNPALNSALSSAAAASARAKRSGYLDDPGLSFEYMLEQHDMQYRIGLMQNIPGFGKLKLKRRIVGHEADAAAHDAEAKRLMVYEMVIKAFHNYIYCRRSLEITAENIKLLEDLEDVMTSQYKANSLPYSALLKVQVEKDKLVNRKASLEELRGVISTRLSFLVGRDEKTLLPWPSAAQQPSATLSEDLLGALNPELKAIESRIEAHESKTRLANKQGQPDYFVGAGYHLMPEQEDGSEPTDFGITVGITLPIWIGKNRAAVTEAEEAVKSVRLARESMKDDLILELKEAIFNLNDAERQITLFKKTLIPKARQALDVARKDFISGKATFMTLIDAQRTLLGLELGLARAAADREIAGGEIGCCIGKFDFGNPDKRKSPPLEVQE